MSKNIPIIDQIRINKPCTANWDSMIGNDEVRFCEHCARDVHNLSAMTRAEAERLVANSNGKLCIRYYPLSGGAIETTDNRRLYPITRKISSIAAGLFSIALAAASPVLANQLSDQNAAVSRASKQKVKGPGSGGSVQGTVVDINGAVIVQADLELTDTSTGKKTSVSSDEMGKFSFVGLKSGTYKLKISATGFKRETVNDIRISKNSSVELESILTVAVMGEVIMIQNPTLSPDTRPLNAYLKRKPPTN